MTLYYSIGGWRRRPIPSGGQGSPSAESAVPSFLAEVPWPVRLLPLSALLVLPLVSRPFAIRAPPPCPGAVVRFPSVSRTGAIGPTGREAPVRARKRPLFDHFAATKARAARGPLHPTLIVNPWPKVAKSSSLVSCTGAVTVNGAWLGESKCRKRRSFFPCRGSMASVVA